MHLKSLTLRGFKSFASATTLRFEPGITAVVGPNGSGKSNVVDAIAWVLGEQGAKSLRGGKMEDVIFAGTPDRPPLGRAEVVLTIDNSDGALPIDYAEVTVSRLMYRSGTSEYAINGTPCRLLDIQELLSDTGIGRELHVIVGQGQLDAVLQARPEERRTFIEEAAGVLKHRRRKEKALRKLDAMQANLTRLTDLTAELRRQLGPLGRQAEVARRAADVQAELRDARLRLLADDLGRLQAAWQADLAAEATAREQRRAVEAALAEAAAAEARLEEQAAAAAPRLTLAARTWYRLGTLAEQLRGTARVAAERAHHLTAEPEPSAPGRDPDRLAEAAVGAQAEQRELARALAAEQSRLAAAAAERRAAEAAAAAAEQQLVAAVRAVADRREGLARLAGQVGAARSRVAAAVEELDRLGTAVAEASSRRAAAEAEFAARQTEVAGLDEGELDLDAEHEAAEHAHAAALSRLAELQQQERAAERERAGVLARRDALAQALGPAEGAGALLDGGPPGVRGSVADLLSALPGAEPAVAAALGAAVSGLPDGVVVADLDAAVAAVGGLRTADAGRAALLIESAGSAGDPSGPPLPDGATWAADLVRVAAELRPAVIRLLAGYAVVPDLAAARELLRSRPELRAVTASGDLLSVVGASGGSPAGRSRIETQAAYDGTCAELAELDHRAERVRFAVAAATAERDEAARRVSAALARLHESDARLAAVAERLAELSSAARAAAAESDRLRAAQDGAGRARLAAEQELAGLADRLAAAEAAPAEGDPDPAERDRLGALATAAREVELEAMLGVRTGEERIRAATARVEQLLAAAAAERAELERSARRRAERAALAELAGGVARAAGVVLGQVQEALTVAGRLRDAAETAQAERERDLAAVRARLRELGAELDGLADAGHRDEMARAELRLRIEAMAAKAADDYGVPAETLLAEFGPDESFQRAEQEERAVRAERALARLGRVNPLALEEYAALEERHAFLAAQLKDLEATRRDLLTVVREVDERVEEVFAAAYADTAREFETVFGTLFPGGSGRLLLTDPGALLTTGIEVEARPAGKKVSRLSLLSGGERSLVAIALLVAIFRARPSPFYVLDEVEAALDERNLGRLVGLFAELRGTSQLVVVTHQRRTMEAADALYGVSIRGDGVTAVISQRLRAAEQVA